MKESRDKGTYMNLPSFGSNNNTRDYGTQRRSQRQQPPQKLQGHGNPFSIPTTPTTTTGTIDNSPGGTQRTNKPVAYITFSHFNGTQRFQEMILGSVLTWLPPEEPMYVVLSKMWFDKFQEWRKRETPASRYAERIVPLFVDCPEGQFGESPCCKQEKGLLEFYDRGLLNRYDWVAYMDDDTYIRPTFLTNFLEYYPVWLQYGTTNFTYTTTDATTTIATAHNKNKKNKNSSVKTDAVVMPPPPPPPPPPTTEPVPPVVFSGGWPPKRLGQAGYKTFRKTPYNCSVDKPFTYPHGQPVVYSAAGLRRILNGLKLGGLVKQCREFNVTHDSGNAIFHWMYSLSDSWIRMPQRPDRILNHYMAIHGVGRCERGPCDMAYIHKRFTNDVEQELWQPLPEEYKYEMHEVAGFHQTETYKLYGDPSSWTKEWHTMPVSNCISPNGTIIATKSTS